MWSAKYMALDDEPDLYETGDEPSELSPKSSGSIEHSGKDIDFDSAFNFFKNARSPKGARNDLTYSTDDALLDNPEALLQRYNEVSQEMKDLQNRIFNFKDDETKCAISELQNLIKSIEQSYEEVNKALTLPESDFFDVTYEELEKVDMRQLLYDMCSECESLLQNEISTDNADREMKLKTQNKPSKMFFEREMKIAELESRISNLEKIIGSKNELPSSVKPDNEDNIFDIVENLKQQISVCDPRSLHNLEEKITSLVKELKSPDCNVSSLIENEKTKQLNELIDNYEFLADFVPYLINRLSTLDVLHQQAANFDALIHVIEDKQQVVAKALESNTMIVKNLRETLMTNLNTLKNTVEPPK